MPPPRGGWARRGRWHGGDGVGVQPPLISIMGLGSVDAIRRQAKLALDFEGFSAGHYIAPFQNAQASA
jgi:hypothetical protein